jgi:tight adherence protein B
MGLVIVLVFAGVFAVVALLMIATGSGAAQQQKQVLATLDSALATESRETREQILNLRKKDAMSGIPWLNKKLLTAELGPQIQNLLHQADLKWTVGGLLSMCAASFLVPAILVNMRFGSLLVACGVGLVTGALPFAVVYFKRGKRFNSFQEGLPESLDLMVSALRAGHSLIAAMGLVSRECPDPVGSEFKACFEEQNFGLELKNALDNLIKRVPLQDLRIVCTAIMIQKESGGNLAEVLDKTAHVIRERFRLKRQVATHTAQGRLTGWILTLLPVALAFALYTVNPEMMSILWKREIGIKLLYTAVSMIIVGGLIIRKIVNMDV